MSFLTFFLLSWSSLDTLSSEGSQNIFSKDKSSHLGFWPGTPQTKIFALKIQSPYWGVKAHKSCCLPSSLPQASPFSGAHLAWPCWSSLCSWAAPDSLLSQHLLPVLPFALPQICMWLAPTHYFNCRTSTSSTKWTSVKVKHSPSTAQFSYHPLVLCPVCGLQSTRCCLK